MKRQKLLLPLFLLLSLAETSPTRAAENPATEPRPELSREDREIVEMLDLLEILELLNDIEEVAALEDNQ